MYNKYKLEIQGVSKSYGDDNVLKSLSLNVYDGERISILGPSGEGKSTLLNIVCGIDMEHEGRILVDGKDVTNVDTSKRNIVIVSQENLLFPHMSVYDNIAFGLRIRKCSTDEIKKSVTKLLSDINLDGYENKRVSELSGGEKQRVAIARAIAVRPEVLLLDEAFSSLDANLRDRMRELVISLQKKYNMTMILVTHDKQEAMRFSDRVAILIDGNISQIDSPKTIWDKPNSLNVAKFLYEYNFIEYRNINDSVRNEYIYPKSDKMIRFVMPHNVEIHKFLNDKAMAEVNRKIYSGLYWIYYLKMGDDMIRVDYYGDKDFNVGEKVGVTFSSYMDFEK